MEEEIIQFCNEIEELLDTASQIPGQKYNFNPILFYLWKLNKQNFKAGEPKLGDNQ